MLEVLKSAEDVIAIRIGGKLGEAEFEDLVGRVESAIAARDKTHMFMEIVDFSGFDVAAFARYLPRGLAMLGKLDRFGRIAVVSDQRWIRLWTRVESALLPGISYELYRPDERDEALAWVEGRRNEAHDASVRIIETDNPDVLAFELDGTIRAGEAEAIGEYFNEAFDRGRPLHILGRIKHLGGAQPGVALNPEYLLMKLRALRGVDRYAVVGGPAWVRTWIALVNPLVKMDVRHFEVDEEGLAWTWVGARPKSEPLAA